MKNFLPFPLRITMLIVSLNTSILLSPAKAQENAHFAGITSAHAHNYLATDNYPAATLPQFQKTKIEPAFAGGEQAWAT
jgi:hypothetical protein